MKQRVNGARDYHRRSTTKPASCRNLICTLLILLLAGLMPNAAFGAGGRGYLDLSGGFKTGDFGTSTTSNLYYISPALGFVTPRYDVSITIPYLILTNKTAGQTVTEEGIGDVILRGGVTVVPQAESGLSLTGSLAVKLPTADENKGLGSGETDYGAFAGLRQRVGQNRFTLSAGYIKVGDPPGVDFNDVTVFDVGYARIFERTELSAWYEGRRAVLPGAKNPQEINVGFFHILDLDWAVKGGAFSGLNKGGPDFGLNLGVVRWF